MDHVRNPFAPGAGNQPPELAGRQAILDRADYTLSRAEVGRHAKSFMLIGLRGVGKTVLLNRILAMALDRRVRALLVEAHEDKALPELLLPPLRQMLLGLDQAGRLNESVKRGLRILKSFAASIKVKYGDVEIGLGIEPELGIGDSGDLESDLPDVFAAIGEAAKARTTVVVLLIDELQYLEENELSALIMAMHRVSQRQLPLVLVGAGLPQLAGNMGRSKSYAERLFEFPTVGALSSKEAAVAIIEPVRNEGERIAKPAVDLIIEASQGYPYFVQAWGYEAWNAAAKSPISRRDVENCEPAVLKTLDQSFFRVRFDRLTPSEKRYLRAMAELGAGPHRSGDIADVLEVRVQSVAPTRNSLIKKGMIYSPAHGDTAFTVPLFDRFLRRQMPKLERSKV
jgi:type II secretory pathway predicted ATPase ExeA